MAFGSWFVKFLVAAFHSFSNGLSYFTIISSLAVILFWAIPKVKEPFDKVSPKILKWARPLSLVAIFACFFIAAYLVDSKDVETLQSQIRVFQAENITATQRIADLENAQALSTKVLNQQTANNLTASPLTIQANIAMTIDRVVNPAYNPSLPPNYRFVFQNLPGIGVSQELFSENSLLAVNFNFYVVAPIKIDSMQLSINGQTLESSPLIIENFTPQLERLELLLWVFFKYEGIIKPGHYDNVKLIAIADNTTFSSNPFTVTIPEPKKQEQ